MLGCGVRRGARRPGRDRPLRREHACRWTSRSRRPSSTSAGGRTPSSTCRSAASAPASLPLQLVEHALESFARTAGATLHLSGTGRNDHHLAEAAFKALGRALRVACELDPRRDGRRLDQGHARSDADARPRIAVVDYGAGNLVSIDQALDDRRRRASTVAATREATRGRGRARRPGRRRRGAGDGRASRRHGLVEPIRAWIAADRPFLGICLGLQLLFEGSDEDGATTLGVLPGPDGPPRRTPRRCRTSAGTRSSGRATHPLFDGIAPGRRLLLRPLVRRRARPTAADDVDPRHDRARRAVRLGGRARRAARRPVPPGAVAARTASGCSRNFVRSRHAARTPAGAPPDAPPPRHPLPRRRRRPRRQGHPLRRPRRRGRSARARRALRRGGRRRARLPRHHRRARGPRHAPRHRRADRAAGVHPADRRRRRPERRRDARRPAGRRRQGLAQHRGGRRPDADQPLRRRGSAARRSSSRSTRARCRRRRAGPVRLGGRRQGRPRADRPRRHRLGGARRRARRRRAAGHLDRPRRDRLRLRHRAAAGDHDRGRRAGHRVRWRRRPGRLRRGGPRRRRRRRPRRLDLPSPDPLDRRRQGGDGRRRAPGPARPGRPSA